jgi:ATP-binding cassette, subfamily B, bacterial
MSQSFRLELLHPVRFGRALKLAWSSSPRWTTISLGLVALQSGLPLLSLYLYKLIIDAVESGLSGEAAVDGGRVTWLVLLAAATALAANWLRSRAMLVSKIQAQEMADHMLALLQEKSTSVDVAYYENPDYHDTLHWAQREAPYRPAQIVQGLVDIGRSGLSLLLLGGLLFSFHWSVPLLLLVSTIPGVIFQLKFANESYVWRWRHTQDERKARYLNRLLTRQLSAREIRLFDIGRFFRERFRDIRGRLRTEGRKLWRRHARVEFITQASGTLALFGAFAFMTHQTILGVITLGTLVVAFQAFQHSRGLLQDLVHSLTEFYEHNLFLANVFEFLDLDVSVVEPQHPKVLPRPMREGFVLEGVGFRYREDGPAVLENVDLAIPRGELVALVGENGSGKTTLAKLLCRLYDPTEGRITLDGIDLRELSVAELRRQISVIFQDYAMYDLLTVRDSIRLGDLDRPPDEDAIVMAAQRGGAHEFIERLPLGYDCLLGHRFETGRELSVGQWQKIALSRAFYRDAQLFILDEPSSALDPLAEAEMFDSFDRTRGDRAALVICHRLAFVRRANRIYVLGENTVVESGTHDELMRIDGRYRFLFEAQSRPYL